MNYKQQQTQYGAYSTDPLSVYRLQLSDGTEFTCKENDLYMLKMDDIYQMYLDFQEIPITRDRTTQDGFEALKRFIIRQIKFFSSHDLQMALETNLPKTNLSRPKLYGPELEDFPAYYIFDSPITLIDNRFRGVVVKRSLTFRFFPECRVS
ncbi:unnamed protein product [Cuscuta epithymum]|uniref:Uncharacterized protein n=1 Tax=Cuscuta epithymum TaxID=186058 RepID=A0AAV0D2E3_9ASTE|nr:unnamed protein product [Cuscuta epithymum]